MQSYERQDLINDVNAAIGLKHLIVFDIYDLCEYYRKDKLAEFTVPMLKSMCSYLEIPFKSRDKKQVLLDILKGVISECKCAVSHK